MCQPLAVTGQPCMWGKSSAIWLLKELKPTAKNSLHYEVILFTVVLSASHQVWLLIIMLVMYVACFVFYYLPCRQICMPDSSSCNTKRWSGGCPEMCEVFGCVDAKPDKDVFELAKQRLENEVLWLRSGFFKFNMRLGIVTPPPTHPPSLDVATLFISKGILK